MSEINLGGHPRNATVFVDSEQLPEHQGVWIGVVWQEPESVYLPPSHLSYGRYEAWLTRRMHDGHYEKWLRLDPSTEVRVDGDDFSVEWRNGEGTYRTTVPELRGG